MTKENKLSLKDIKKMTSEKGRRHKKIRIEKLNLAASLKIKAHENLTQDNKKDEILNLKDQVREQLKTNDIPLDAYTAILDDRIKTMNGRIESFETKKADNGGHLRPSEENSLANYKEHLKKYEEDKEKTIKEFSDNERSAEVVSADQDNDDTTNNDGVNFHLGENINDN